MSKSGNRRTPMVLEARRLLGRAQQKLQSWRGTAGQIYFEDRVDQYRQIWKAVAVELDARFVALSEEIWEIHKNEGFLRLCQYKLELDNPVTLELAGNKPSVHKLLSENGIDVPPCITFSLNSLWKAEEFLEKHPYGIVIKPASGYAGKGVTTNVVTKSDIRSAGLLASLYDKTLLAEKQIAGECFRLLTFRGKVLSAVRRTGLRVIGDGRSNLHQLISNLQSSNSQHEPVSQREISLNLDAQSLQPDSVPETNQEIVINGVPISSSKTELRTVYDTEVLSSVCKEILDCAESSARILRSDFLGVDIITTNIEKPLHETSGVVNEANTTPALHHHYDSNHEAYPKVALQIVKQILATEGNR